MKTLLTLDNDEAREVAQTIICDIADQIEVIQDCMTLSEEENYSFIAILKDIKESQSEEARELLAFMLGISSLDLDLHIQDIIDEKFNSED
tara:strand:- start:215 stop:487 length:273 start_codon:yes stop_codon:yes gene_type:complete